MTNSTDGEGNTTTYEYNNINQLAVVTDPTGEHERYHYDVNGRLCSKTDRNGTETKYTYNIYDNLIEHKARRTELADRYEYTPEGLLKSAISKGMCYSYAYDVMGRLAEKKVSGRTLLSFKYDQNGNLTHQTDVTGKVTEYQYDLMDNISEVWDNRNKIASYEYNTDNTIKSISCGSLYTEYAYDADRNLTGLKTVLGTDIITDNKYTYDGNGNRIEKQQKHGTIKYSYDNMNRLNKVQYPNATEELFYDKAGNRIKRLYNGMEELYQYDRRNRLATYTKEGISTQYEYDNAGNLLKDDKAKYEYDAFNRNIKVETFNGNVQINHYDAEGLRHEMEENGKLVSFIFRGNEIVAEESQEDKIRYIRTNTLIASDAESARTYYHYASDEMSSITHVVDSEIEGILNRYEYDAWGNLTACEEEVPNRFKFNGQQYDSVTQQYYLRARYYNPVIGRFTQEDTYRGDGLNLYAYCANNPICYVDPSGHTPCEEEERKRLVTAVLNNTATEEEKISARPEILTKEQVIEKAKKFAESTDYDSCRTLEEVRAVTNRKLEYDALPTVVSEDEFQVISRGKDVLYRGVHANGDKTAQEIADEFKHGALWTGSKKCLTAGQGIYFTPHKNIANDYAGSDGVIIEMVLLDDTRVGNHLDLLEEFWETGITKIKEEKREYYQHIIGDEGQYAAVKGYEAIDMDGFNHNDHIVLLNRKKAIVKE